MQFTSSLALALLSQSITALAMPTSPSNILLERAAAVDCVPLDTPGFFQDCDLNAAWQIRDFLYQLDKYVIGVDERWSEIGYAGDCVLYGKAPPGMEASSYAEDVGHGLDDILNDPNCQDAGRVGGMNYAGGNGDFSIVLMENRP